MIGDIRDFSLLHTMVELNGYGMVLAQLIF